MKLPASLNGRFVADAGLRRRPGRPYGLDAIYPSMEKLYIDLHQNPELAHETRTPARLGALTAIRAKTIELLELLGDK